MPNRDPVQLLFTGEIFGNAGPSNVNKCIVKNITKSFWMLSNRNKYLRLLEGCMKVFLSDAVVASGVSRQGCIFMGVAKLLGKKTAYIMHGCAEYEVVINQQQNMESGLRQERFLLENADLLLPVSKKFSNWVRERFPQYAEKTGYLFNGIDLDTLADIEPCEKKRGLIIAAGADCGVKNNIVVANAVEKMCGKANLEVYGRIYHSAPQNMQYAKYMGVLPNDEFRKKLASADVFVLNSIFETFSIAAIEALLAGCSVLLSEIAGVTDLLELEESDIIHDPMDEDEIRRKIEYLMDHPNNERIMSKLDLNEWSYQKQVERLEKICIDLVQNSK